MLSSLLTTAALVSAVYAQTDSCELWARLGLLLLFGSCGRWLDEAELAWSEAVAGQPGRDLRRELVSVFEREKADQDVLNPADAPTRITCPDNLVTRTGSPLNGSQVLGTDEAAYLDARRANVLPALYYSYLQDTTTGSTGYNATALFSAGVPKTGLTCSGGGLRASLYCAGALSAFDSRNSSTAGGLLQLADYMTGLSGGSWAVSSFAMNDLPPIYDLVLGNSSSTSTPGWLLDNSILDPGGLLHPIDDVEYINQLLDDTKEKEKIVSISISGRYFSLDGVSSARRACG